jgi:hypothetical protein
MNKRRSFSSVIIKLNLLFVGYILTGLFCVPTANAVFYYVSPTGSDANQGTQNAPFATIQKGIDMAVAGDTVKVFPGTYIQVGDYIYGQVGQFVNKHGTANNYIALEAFDPHQKPVIRGFSGIRVLASSYIKISGFEIKDFSASGIPVYLSDHIRIENNKFSLGFDHTCTYEEGQQGLCSYYSSNNLGEIVGRVDKNGQPIREHDGRQNTGIYFCKSADSVITQNVFINLDESVYIGKAGNVSTDDCYSPTYATGRVYNENITIEENYFLDSWNEAIELKPDTRFNIISRNVIKSTRPAIETSQIEIRGHDNQVTQNIVVGAPNEAIRVISETVSDPGSDRVEAYKKPDGSYKSSYRNNISNNYIYYWGQYIPSSNGIDVGYSSAANIVKHNTVVGINNFSGAVSSYNSIKSYSYPETVVADNLMIGIRRYDYTAGSTKYESHLSIYEHSLPVSSDYNAYFPKFKSNNNTCVVNIGTLGIICQNNNLHNQSVGYEFNSKFLEANPIRGDEAGCAKEQLILAELDQLEARIKDCSTPLPGSAIVGAASDGTTIGAAQTTNPTSPSPSPTTIPGDANHDSRVDGIDYMIWHSHYNQPVRGVEVGDFDNSGNVDGVDYMVWLNNYNR